MVDWGAGCYERTAGQVEPVARAVVDAAHPRANDWVLDLACGTGKITVMRETNEDPGGFLVHSPYAVHELRA
jgi:ubiquinone/menaquinone biosynthesis C-methylase UbiE